MRISPHLQKRQGDSDKTLGSAFSSAATHVAGSNMSLPGSSNFTKRESVTTRTTGSVTLHTPRTDDDRSTPGSLHTVTSAHNPRVLVPIAVKVPHTVVEANTEGDTTTTSSGSTCDGSGSSSGGSHPSSRRATPCTLAGSHTRHSAFTEQPPVLAVHAFQPSDLDSCHECKTPTGPRRQNATVEATPVRGFDVATPRDGDDGGGGGTDGVSDSGDALRVSSLAPNAGGAKQAPSAEGQSEHAVGKPPKPARAGSKYLNLRLDTSGHGSMNRAWDRRSSPGGGSSSGGSASGRSAAASSTGHSATDSLRRAQSEISCRDLIKHQSSASGTSMVQAMRTPWINGTMWIVDEQASTMHYSPTKSRQQSAFASPRSSIANSSRPLPRAQSMVASSRTSSLPEPAALTPSRLASHLLNSLGISGFINISAASTPSSENSGARSPDEQRHNDGRSSDQSSVLTPSVTPSEYSDYMSSRRSSQLDEVDIEAAKDWEHHFPLYKPWDSVPRARPTPHHIDLFPEHLAPHSNFEWFSS